MDFKFFCPDCGQHILTSTEAVGTNVLCPGCSQPIVVPSPALAPPQTTPTPIPSASIAQATDFSDSQIGQIAKWQKTILWLILVSIIALCIHSLWFVSGILNFAFIYLLARSLRYKYPWMYALLSFVPLIGIVCIFVLNQKAIKILRQHGIAVGLMGAKRSSTLDTDPLASSQTKPQSTTVNRFRKPAIVGGCVLVGLIIIISNVNTFKRSHESPEQILTNDAEQGLTQNKQTLFNSIHPIGTAKSVTVHDVSIKWKTDHPTSWNDMLQFTVRFTLYWEGPITKDGYTKMAMTYDNESRRFVSSQILATNGITNGDAGNAVVNLLGGVLQFEAEKEGSKQAVSDYLNNQ